MIRLGRVLLAVCAVWTVLVGVLLWVDMREDSTTMRQLALAEAGFQANNAGASTALQPVIDEFHRHSRSAVARYAVLWLLGLFAACAGAWSLDKRMARCERAEDEVERDESRSRRLTDILQHPSVTMQEFLDYALEQAVQTTGSKIGHIFHYYEDRREFVLSAWSREVMPQCAVADPATCCGLDKTGIWGEAVRQRRPIIVNDFQSAHPLKKGYPEGHVRIESFMTVPIFRGNSIVGVVGLANKGAGYGESDILQVSLMMETVWKVTARMQAEEELRTSRAKLEAALASMVDSLFISDAAGKPVHMNDAFVSFHRFGNRDECVRCLSEAPDIVEMFTAGGEPVPLGMRAVPRALRGETVRNIEYTLRRRDTGETWTGNYGFSPICGEDGVILGAVVVARDVTERKQAEMERVRLETQLQQAQKMESFGRLAGGVAHDFNNMLGVILGYTDVALGQVEPDQRLHKDLEQISKAAHRAVDLTRQLLAFARRQSIAPRVLDLNVTVEGMFTMLQRLIGENIRVNWQPGTDLWPIRMDPSQIDQILTNLCVNARDAIAETGTIAIGTENCTVDESYCAGRVGLVPGAYVLLTVSDSGHGMEDETLGHIFEPFFTTKKTGKGTGLGLATIYGIVKQNNGFIDVHSGLGLGTVFTIYLPRHAGKAEQQCGESAPGPPMRGQETILLVEDERPFLNLVATMLEDQGYTVLAADSPNKALRLAREHGEEIHLLMTDVVMPEMNGHSLAMNILALCPRLNCLFMSGYTDDVVARNGVREE
jgi:signal transduction histidine kinase/CheY-like chemotaxis protein